jgi:hypothetical protein
LFGGIGSDDFSMPLTTTTFQLLFIIVFGTSNDNFAMPLAATIFQVVINTFINRNSKNAKFHSHVYN